MTFQDLGLLICILAFGVLIYMVLIRTTTKTEGHETYKPDVYDWHHGTPHEFRTTWRYEQYVTTSPEPKDFDDDAWRSLTKEFNRVLQGNIEGLILRGKPHQEPVPKLSPKTEAFLAELERQMNEEDKDANL